MSIASFYVSFREQMCRYWREFGSRKFSPRSTSRERERCIWARSTVHDVHACLAVSACIIPDAQALISRPMSANAILPVGDGLSSRADADVHGHPRGKHMVLGWYLYGMSLRLPHTQGNCPNTYRTSKTQWQLAATGVAALPYYCDSFPFLRCSDATRTAMIRT